MAEGDGFRRDKGHARVHDSGPQPLLQPSLDGGQIGAAVDPGQQGLIELSCPRLQPGLAGKRHHVGQIEFTGGVVLTQLSEQVEQHGVADQHQPTVTQGQRALFGRGIAVFNDSGRAALGVEDNPAIARRLPGLKGAERQVGPIGERVGDQFRQRLRRHQRRIGIEHQRVARRTLQRILRLSHGVASTLALGLNRPARDRMLPR